MTNRQMSPQTYKVCLILLSVASSSSVDICWSLPSISSMYVAASLDNLKVAVSHGNKEWGRCEEGKLKRIVVRGVQVFKPSNQKR